MKLTICRLDASFFLTERTVSWIMQSLKSFLENVSKEDIDKSELGVGTAFSYYARASYDSSRNASNLVFEFDKKYIFKPLRESVKGMENPNTLSSWSRLMGFIYDDEGSFKIGEFANKYVANNRINTKELCLAILAKQWIVVDEQCERSLLSVIYELMATNDSFLLDLANYSSSKSILNDERRNRLQKSFFLKVVGREANSGDIIQFSRFDALKNTLLLAGILTSNMNGDIIVSKQGLEILKDFNKNESRLSKYNPIKINNKEIYFHKYMSSASNGIFEIVRDDNFDIYKSYNNLFGKCNYNFMSKDNQTLQRIYYGAPGTGKSNEIKELTSERGKDGIKFSKNFTFRTTFHPDSDYSTFVGAYKPSWSDEKDKIVYGFRPQTFLKAYVEAWKNPEENVALVIEEINRGNCAQIFGDIFQLLDREASGLSKYPIEADVDMQSYIKAEFEEINKVFEHEQIALIDNYYEQHYDAAFEKIKNGEILALPMNLSILATMNTSDQSLFPMDSAFKRRWEWVYTPIVNAEKDWKIEIDGYQPIDWWTFLERINKVVAELTISEDKQLGYFFCIPDKKEDDGDIEPTIITADRFVGKVIFYLWNDVFKDYAFDASCCKDNDGKEVLFAQFYGADGKTINTDVLVQFFNNLKDLNGKESPLAIKRQAEIAEEETEAEEENSNEE